MAAEYFSNDTIAAIATPLHAVGALGIVRISGEKAMRAASMVLKAQNPKLQNASGSLLPKELQSHHLYRCDFLDASGQALDDGMFTWMRSPNSFTGEDCLEFHMHGNPYILNRMVEALVATKQVRLALPGEFTFRAFRNGKLDLAQAEAVGDLISAKSNAAIRSAFHALRGSVGRAVDQIKDELLACLAHVELEIDFADQGVSHMNYDALAKEIASICEKIERFRERFSVSRPVREGIRTAIVGAPNAGKSTLFNQLLGEDRSIVSEIAGTTRDVVRENILFGDVLLVLSDTAGIRDSEDRIESQGIERSLIEVEDAHLVFAVVDGLDPAATQRNVASDFLRKLQQRNPSAKIILILNKQDLLAADTWRSRLLSLKEFAPVGVSAQTGAGMDALHRRIFDYFTSSAQDFDGTMINQLRHYETLGRAQAFLTSAGERLRRGEFVPDLLALDLRGAMDIVGEITGVVSTDDVLNHIFAKFCIGK